jgi:hypothetical protein
LNFQDAEKTYKDLRAQHAAGKLSDADFEGEVAKLRLQDSQGRWWQIGVQTGEWYMHDGQKWNKARPPAAPPPSAPPSTPGGVPEAAVPKAKAGSALPARLFSAAPAGRSNGGGLPPALLIVIVAVVALVGLGALVGIYFLISGQAGGGTTARATTTPTVSIAGVLPTPEIPTITLEAPTDTPEPPPTFVISATEAVTATNTPAVARSTATRKPAVTVSPTGPTETATPNVPPGLYATGLKTDPAKPSIGDTLQFTVEFLNTTGSVQTYTWFVKVYQCPEQCDTYKNSFGETTKRSDNIPTGSASLTSDRHVNIGVGRCDYTAIPYYVDQSNQQVVPFMSTAGHPLYENFTVCH